MGILADADAVGSQLLATLGAATILAIAALVWKILRAVQRMNDHVLPHFVPPSPEEIRAGQPDNTIPARMARFEAQVEVLDGKATVAADSALKVSADLSAHLVEETANGVVTASALQAGAARMQGLEDGQAAIKDQLTETLLALAAGNPEIRPG